MAPVVNRHASRARPLRLNLGKPIVRPFRRPCREAAQLCGARASPSNPEEWASLLLSAHQGAT